jgi:pseudouridine kinase
MTEFSMPNRLSDQPVLVIGAAVLDMVGVVADTPLSGTVNQANIRVSFGGVARNVSENLARLGQPVQLITAVGHDQLGNDLLVYTAACGVSVQSCLHSDSHSTAAYVTIMDAGGARYITLEDMAVLVDLTPDFLLQQKGLIGESAMLFVDANLPPMALKAVLHLARQVPIPVCTDATSVLLAERLLPHLDQIHMLTANSAEASVLCQNNPRVIDQDTALTAARSLVNRGVELAVVTLAEFGVVYATSETSGHIPAVVTRVVDPTGAGDALTATIIFGLMNDIPMDEAVRLGVTAASLILRHRGTIFPELSLEKLYDELVS